MVKPIPPNQLYWVITISMSVISILLLCFSLACWFIGFHTSDQAHDLTISTLQMGHNPAQWDLCTDIGKCYSYFDAYAYGILLQKRAVFSIIISAFMVAFSLVSISKAGKAGGI